MKGGWDKKWERNKLSRVLEDKATVLKATQNFQTEKVDKQWEFWETSFRKVSKEFNWKKLN